VEDAIITGEERQVAHDRDLEDAAADRRSPGDERVAGRTLDADPGPIGGSTEARPVALLGRWGSEELADADPDRRHGHEEEREDRDEHQVPVRDAHGHAPVGGAQWPLPEQRPPARLRRDAAGLREHVVERPDRDVDGLVGHPAGDHPLERQTLVGHVARPRGWRTDRSTSSVIAIRMVSSPRCSRDLAVPTGMSRIVAASVKGKPT
jgi:hypothetical protein